MLSLSPVEMCLERNQNYYHTNCRLLSSHCPLSGFVSGQALHLEHLPGPNLFIGVAVTWTTEFSVLSPLRFCWWVVSSVRSEYTPNPLFGLYSNRCVIIFLWPQDMCHFGMVLAYVGTTCRMIGIFFIWILTEWGGLNGTVHMGNGRVGHSMLASEVWSVFVLVLAFVCVASIVGWGR